MVLVVAYKKHWDTDCVSLRASEKIRFFSVPCVDGIIIVTRPQAGPVLPHQNERLTYDAARSPQAMFVARSTFSNCAFIAQNMLRPFAIAFFLFLTLRAADTQRWQTYVR